MTGVKGVTGWLASGLDSLVSVFFGVFVATMTFFLVLLNPKEMQDWIARLLPWPREQADRLFSTSGQVIFDYYKGCTILAFVNAIPVWIVARVLGVEAAGSILVVLFESSYIPYVGAWIGGAFRGVDGGGFRRHGRRLDHAGRGPDREPRPAERGPTIRVRRHDEGVPPGGVPLHAGSGRWLPVCSAP